MAGGGHGKIPFESHLTRLVEPARAMLVDLRGFVLSLGTNVLEDVRPHRIVYSKTMNFRIFLDVEPTGDSLVLSVRYGRAAPPATITIRLESELDAAKRAVADAYEKIQ